MIQIECESRIDRVVVYARGAVVTRKVALPDTLPPEAVRLRVGGLTALAETGSVRALARGGREVTSIKARAVIPKAAPKPGRLREQVRGLGLERDRIVDELTRATARRGELAGLTPEPSFPRWARHPDPAARFQDALALGGLIAAELTRLDGRVRSLEEALEDVRRRLAAAEIDAAQGTPGELEGDGRAEVEVEVRLDAASAPLLGLEIDYVVTAARWWPAYTARFSAAATRVSLAIEAFVAQASGEAWSGVELAISTADLASDVRLPELRSLRIGRAQAAPRKGYRPPPAGLEAMFEGYDRAAAQLEEETKGAMEESTRASRFQELTALTRTQAGSIAQGGRPPMPPPPGAPMGYGGAVPVAAASAPAPAAPSRAMVPMAMPAAAPQSMARASRGKSRGIGALLSETLQERSAGYAEEIGSIDALAADEPSAPAAIEPDEHWLDFDTLTLIDPFLPQNQERRGRLARDGTSLTAGRVATARAAIEALAPPPEAHDPTETRGRFDHRYAAEGAADVPSSGRPHRVTIAAAEGDARPRFVAVPREAAEVYREAEIPNPFAAPLLSGPVDVFVDGALLTTSRLSFVDRGGQLHLGLGVEERLRVARNARVEEGTAGLLGGSTTIDHHLTIDVASSLGHAVTVDVLDRIPVTNDKDIEIKIVGSKPAAAKITQADRGHPVRGGVSWQLGVGPGEKQRIELTYRVTLPAKNELVGGNRRE